jgi:Leucine-rich repeat (LRR) protein
LNGSQINLEGNPLQVLDHSTVMAVTSLTNLNILNLARTKLSEIPTDFLAGLPHLLKLDLSYNEFIVVPEETEKAQKLIEFNIDGNLMKDFSRNSFIGMSCLEILSASDMKFLEKIEAGAFRCLVILKDNFTFQTN